MKIKNAFIAVQPVINFGDEAPQQKEDAIPSTSSTSVTSVADRMATEEANAGSDKGGPYKKKNKGQRKKVVKVNDDTTNTAAEQDEVDAHLYQPVPKKIRIEDLRKLAFIAQIEKDKSIKKCADAITNFLPTLKKFMAYSVPEVKVEHNNTDHGGYCFVIPDCD